VYHPLADGPESRGALLAEADKAIAAGDRTLTIGLDGLKAIDARAMGSLIVALRRMREAGGSVLLHVTRPELLSELCVSGLDRVFKIVAEPAPPASEKSKQPKRSGGARRIAGGLA
jgi:anti-anti-sigma regulatory factor